MRRNIVIAVSVVAAAVVTGIGYWLFKKSRAAKAGTKGESKPELKPVRKGLAADASVS